MATETTLQASSAASPAGPASPALRHLWQVPVFVAGVVAVTAIWAARPMWQDQGGHQLEHDLAAARRALDQPSPEVDRVLVLADGILQQTSQFPQYAGEAHFLVGSAYLHRAIHAATDATADFQKARDHLEQADALGVPRGDRDRLMYRLARVWYQAGIEPQRVVDYLSRSAASGTEDQAETLHMLSQAYLRLPKPDTSGALAANEKLLALPTADVKVLAPARLQRAELLVRLHRRGEARRVLANVSAEAPPEIYTRARRLHAELAQQDEAWSEAQKLWQEIVQDSARSPADVDRVFFFLGIACAHQGNSTAACQAWEKAMVFDGEAGQAAAVRLAETALRDSNAGRTAQAFERVLRNVSSPAAWHNSLVDLAEARRLFEEACEYYRSSGEYDAARKLSLTYAKIAPPGKAQVLRAEALDGLARDSRDKAHRAQTEDEARQAEHAARVYDAQAAAAYEEAAEPVQGQAAEADRLWRSADRYLQSQEYEHAAGVLKRYLQANGADEHRAQAWFSLGSACQALHQDIDAEAAFFKCIEVDHTGPFAYRARYQLAEAAIKLDKLDDAETILKQNIELMGVAPDPEAHEKSLLALAGLLYRRSNYRLAAVYLQQALDRYPANSRTTMARHILADSYRRLAEQEKKTFPFGMRSTSDAQLHARDQYRLWLNMAAANYQKLKEDLITHQAKSGLPEAEEAILREAELAEINCRFDLGQYDYAIGLAQILVERYRDRAESMVAYRQILRCYWTMGQKETDKAKREQLTARARETLKMAQAHLKDLNELAFHEESGTHTRAWWDGWLKWAAQQW